MMALLVVLAVVLLVAVGLALYGWQVDRQLHRGLLQQRAQAAARADWVPLDELPAHLPAAVMAAVDPDFLERPRATLEAQPTLARDLIRQLHQLRPDLRGQARELTLGVLLDLRLERRDVLELYLNRVDFGDHDGAEVFGVQHAAREYFQRDPRELTLSQSATLAGLLLPPRLEEPGSWPGALGARRNEVLRSMMAEGDATSEQVAAALAEPIELQRVAAHTPMTRPERWLAEPAVIRISPMEPAPPR
jgi:penicillin-binding protein 1A